MHQFVKGKRQIGPLNLLEYLQHLLKTMNFLLSKCVTWFEKRNTGILFLF